MADPRPTGRLLPLAVEGLSALDTIRRELASAGLLPTNKTWWFGWRELELSLPQLLDEAVDLPNVAWDVVHIFSFQVELRLHRRGLRQTLWLLYEDEGHNERDVIKALSGINYSIQTYDVERSYRILWGNKLHIRDSSGQPADARGVVSFPRPLDYGLDKRISDLTQAIVAPVCLYYDDQHRLCHVRYAGSLRHEHLGAIEVKPFVLRQEA